MRETNRPFILAKCFRKTNINNSGGLISPKFKEEKTDFDKFVYTISVQF